MRSVPQKIPSNVKSRKRIEDRLDTVEAAVRLLRNDAKAAPKANDLLVTSVPMMTSDNPVNIYCSVASVIGYLPRFSQVFRLDKNRSNVANDPPRSLISKIFPPSNAQLVRTWIHDKQTDLRDEKFDQRQLGSLSNRLEVTS
jgi:hypothetical protein